MKYTKESVDEANEYCKHIRGYGFDTSGEYEAYDEYYSVEDIKTLYEASLLLEKCEDE